ncbi:MAG: hypothetical protein ACRDD7_11270 [Peptostreptococcaceae bacterium]
MNYEITVERYAGDKSIFNLDKESILKAGNVQNYILNVIKYTGVKRILVKMFNQYTNKHFYEITYDQRLEDLKRNNNRVELTYTFESGNSEKTSCYIGKSTGFIPCYLEIKRKNSSGGGALLTSCISNIRIKY